MADKIEHISESDVLNAGREKINKFAIDPALRAEQNSLTAKNVANQSQQISTDAKDIAKNTDGRLDNIVAGEMKDAEVIDARKPFDADSYETLSKRLDEQIGKNSEFRNFENDVSFMQRIYNENAERGINAKWFGAKGDGVKDDSEAIINAITHARSNNLAVFIPTGTYLVTKKIILNSLDTISGVGDQSEITFSGDGGFEVAATTNRITVKSLKITTADNNMTAFYAPNDTRAFNMENLTIENFEYGFKSDDLYWYSNQKNVRYNNCNYSIYVSGQNNINNVFDNVYSNQARILGLFLADFYGSLISCNFGGLIGDNALPARLIETALNSCITMTSCNFEHATVADVETIKFTGTSFITMTSCSVWRHNSTNATMSVLGLYNGARLNCINTRERNNTNFASLIKQYDYSTLIADNEMSVQYDKNILSQSQTFISQKKRVLLSKITQKESNTYAIMESLTPIKIIGINLYAPDGTGRDGAATFTFKYVSASSETVIGVGGVGNGQPTLTRSKVTLNQNKIPANSVVYLVVSGSSTYNAQKIDVEILYES